jgi:hypothetical protein
VNNLFVFSMYCNVTGQIFSNTCKMLDTQI